jgi:hypothetical protein
VCLGARVESTLSFGTGNHHSLVQPGLIDGLSDSAERIQSLLATLALVEEVSNRRFDQFIFGSGRWIVPARPEFLLQPVAVGGLRLW